MLSVDEAFGEFKSRLELNEREKANASRRQTEVRQYLDSVFLIARSFLTGSYARYTKTKPLKDIDIFVVLDPKLDATYRKKAPSVVLDAFYDALVKEYGRKAVRKQSRSVNVDFGVVVDADDNTDYRIVSVDVVPAFADGEDYVIPDAESGKWMRTNPEIHAQRAVVVHQAFSNQWKGLVRMLKYWNNHAQHGQKPIKPSFLIEVMALKCVHGGWGGSFAYEVQALFQTMADRIEETWPDPAGLGPAVSDGMDAAAKKRARECLLSAARQAAIAINHTREGRNGEALRTWRSLFGPKFPVP